MIEFNKPNKYSMIIAIVLYVSVFFLGFFLGMRYENAAATARQYENGAIKAVFACPDAKAVYAEFTKEKVSLVLSDGRKIDLNQTISGSGARYANSDESFVFWNKGNGAFIEENGTTTYEDCVTAE
ncbi:MAG: MliC family protein [Candidatus Pacebacteria bacterium]|nr:MliC family protein [Candidatus Paceibacterota bacterium]